MFRRFSINFALTSMILDGLAVFLSLKAAEIFRPLLNRFSWIEPLPSYVTVPAVLYFLFPVTWVIIYSVLSIYDGRKYLRAMDEFAALSLAMLIASVSTAGLLYISHREVSRALFFLFLLYVYLACLTWRILARVYFRSQNTYPDRARHVVIVGTGPLGQRVKDQLLKTELPNLTFAGFVEDHTPLGQDAIRPLGNASDIRGMITRYEVTDVVIALPHSEYHQLAEIVQKMEDLPLRVWVALGFFDLTLYHTSIEDFAGIPMLDMRASAIDEYQRILKRGFDLFFGSLALFLTLPFMVLAALLVFLDDGRPVLFHQQRVGEYGKLFRMIKFRTMVKNAEQLQVHVQRRDEAGNILHKNARDPRITRVGRILRRFSLDELPQLFNVIKGDMSLVGPRPELPYLVEQYQPWQRKRFSVPPGMTGWWQVTGRSDKPMHLHTEDDLYYIQNYSIGLDVLILIRTIWIVLLGRGSY